MSFSRLRYPGGVRGLATETGQELLERDPTIRHIVDSFALHGNLPEVAGLQEIGRGKRSIVHSFGGWAIKRSGEDTLRRAEMAAPENLFGQFKFLDALGAHLEDNENVGTPEQALVLGSSGGTQLKIEALVRDHIPFEDWAVDGERVLSDEERLEYIKDIRGVIKEAVGGTALAVGINDVIDVPKSRTPRIYNVLTDARASEPFESRVWLIDQPNLGILGAATAFLHNASSRLRF